MKKIRKRPLPKNYVQLHVEHCQDVVDNVSYMDLMKEYESFFCDVIDGKYGSTVAYWAIYVFHQTGCIKNL